ncbi:MAG: hypothetical protein WBW81_02670 [Methylocella sp.]
MRGGPRKGPCARDAPPQTSSFLTGIVRKKLGLTLVYEKPGEERVYRIVANDVSR